MPQGVTSVIQAITGEGLAQGSYVAARGGVEPTTFRTEGTGNIHLTNHAPKESAKHAGIIVKSTSLRTSTRAFTPPLFAGVRN